MLALRTNRAKPSAQRCGLSVCYVDAFGAKRKMKNILFGNGLNINFSGSEYTNKSIIIRALTNIKTHRNPVEAYTKEVGDWLGLLFNEYAKTMDGCNDQYCYTNYEKKALNEFKQKYRYCKSVKIYDIGFEDYFLLHDIFCYKNEIVNPDRFMFREVLKRMFLDSIYFNGKINNLHSKYSKSFIQYIQSFDNIFTTNYDRNIELATGRDVNYLHGAFHIVDDVYNENSFRNSLSDVKNNDLSYFKKNPYLFSTALSSYSGELKEYSMNQSKSANLAIEKYADKYMTDNKVKDEIDKWKDADSDVVKNLYEGVLQKIKNKKLKFSENYPIDLFKMISGELTIIGLSPCNDTHIFNCIEENTKINLVDYYYYSENEITEIQKLIHENKIACNDVKLLWENFT
jgi:hypothetical protein